MLGECQSKCDHLAGVPLQHAVAQELHTIYLAKGVQATTAIEGNTLSEEQVRQQIEHTLELPPSQKYLQQEIDNIIRACDQITGNTLRSQELSCSTTQIKEFNRLVLKDLDLDEGVVPGEVSRHMVGVGRYRGAPREDCDHLLERLTEWLNSDDFAPKEPLHIGMAIIKAIVAHLYLAWIHAFGDGNGRTARLLEFKILLASGVPQPATQLLSNFYNQTRVEYYRQLDYASKSGGDVMRFLTYAVRGFRDGLREQIERVRQQQLEVAWINYVHQLFKNKDGQASTRRRKLILDLSPREEPVPLDGLRDVSGRMAAAYADKTRKTVARDVNILCEMGLLRKTADGYRTNKEIVMAFLPAKVNADAR